MYMNQQQQQDTQSKLPNLTSLMGIGLNPTTIQRAANISQQAVVPNVKGDTMKKVLYISSYNLDAFIIIGKIFDIKMSLNHQWPRL